MSVVNQRQQGFPEEMESRNAFEDDDEERNDAWEISVMWDPPPQIDDEETNV